MSISTIAARRREWLFWQLEPTAWQRKGLSPVNSAITVVILFSVCTTVSDSEPEISLGREYIFRALDLVVGLLFVVEYVGRMWVSAENPKYGLGLRGKLRFIRSPNAILDLLALSPVLLAGVGGEAYLFRLFRLVRVLRLAKLGRYSSALSLLSGAIRSRRYELMVSMAFAAMLLLVTSTLLYLVEGDAQPENFGSIPRAMWWSIATLTTVGYGDVYPHTPFGKVLAGLTAVISIGLIAMPTGILLRHLAMHCSSSTKLGNVVSPSNEPAVRGGS